MDAFAGSTLTAVQPPAETGCVCAPRSDVLDEKQWRLLRQALDTEWTIFDGESGELLYADEDQPPRDWGLLSELCREVARRGRPEFIDEEDPFLVLALPIADAEGNPAVAVGTFIARPIEVGEDLAEAARSLGTRPEETAIWAGCQEVWPADALQRVAELVVSQGNAARQAGKLQREADDLSVHLANTYEEISLLYRLTQNLKISESDEGLGRISLQWMKEVVPAEGLAIQLLPVAEDDERVGHESRREAVLLTHGDCPIDNGQFTALVEHLGAGVAQRPIVINPPVSTENGWPHPEIRQMVVVSLAEGDNLFGYLAAINHVEDAEFGTVEASLMSSVAAILGIHSGNIELYRRQSELMAGIVRALTSAIDAKDRYTCGHSDRVAQIAVRLAEELGCDAETVNTIYLSGQLHDIGKIGTDDSVLRKPGKLTDEEYEHIKGHVEIGNKILSDLGKLDEVLPVIRHHHEHWDGTGYPHRLKAREIPLSARIVAVADAFDAMSSDRPYRKGMPDGKIDAIFRSGSAQQWDPDVVDAFFRGRDDIRQIVSRKPEEVGVGLPQQV